MRKTTKSALPFSLSCPAVKGTGEKEGLFPHPILSIPLSTPRESIDSLPLVGHLSSSAQFCIHWSFNHEPQVPLPAAPGLTACSHWTSRALVASSRMRTRGFRTRARAMARHCLCPAASCFPFSPTSEESEKYLFSDTSGHDSVLPMSRDEHTAGLSTSLCQEGRGGHLLDTSLGWPKRGSTTTPGDCLPTGTRN